MPQQHEFNGNYDRTISELIAWINKRLESVLEPELPIAIPL